MNFELSGGSLYIQDINGEPELFAEDVCGVADLQASATEALSMYCNLKSSANLSCEMKYFDLDLLDKICDTAPTGHFILQYQRPIMIQARWHKKPRIRKKWLKRYGMKPDTVEVHVNANVLEYYPVQPVDECWHDSVCAVSHGFEFEAHDYKYIFRPDQKRRGLKIEW